MRVLSLVLLLALSGLYACSWPFGSDSPLADVGADNLYQHWIHSREEDPGTDGAHVFRPSDHGAFAPSWFRMEYVLRPDGTCQWMYLAPDDGHHLREGTCRREFDELHIQHGDVPVSYRIIELQSDLLKIAPLSH